jgi:hypothetical protein
MYRKSFMDHVRTGTFIYKITDKERGKVQRLRDPLISGFFGLKDTDISAWLKRISNICILMVPMI